jgi:Nif-specific regulatory protein
VLQEREFERVGGNRPIKVDVRLVTATNRNLGRWRPPGVPGRPLLPHQRGQLFLPALRERREDIPPLVGTFSSKFNRENQRNLT